MELNFTEKKPPSRPHKRMFSPYIFFQIFFYRAHIHKPEAYVCVLHIYLKAYCTFFFALFLFHCETHRSA